MICDKNACGLGCGGKYAFFMVKEREILQEISEKYTEENQSTNGRSIGPCYTIYILSDQILQNTYS